MQNLFLLVAFCYTKKGAPKCRQRVDTERQTLNDVSLVLRTTKLRILRWMIATSVGTGLRDGGGRAQDVFYVQSE